MRRLPLAYCEVLAVSNRQYPAGMNTHNPESNPTRPFALDSPKGVHGFAKLLCVTVWFLLEKLNVTVSPIFAVRLSGENASAPFAPTVTTWLAVDEGAEAVVAAPPVVVAYVVVCVAPLTVTVAVTVITLAEEAETFPVAVDLNVSNLSPGLIAKTMPC